MSSFYKLVVCIFVFKIFASASSEKSLLRTPLIIVPGDAGNQVFGRLSNPDPTCTIKKDWFQIWINIWFVLRTQCLSKYFSLIYDPATRRTRNPPGVEIRLPDWGDTQAVEYLVSDPLGDYYGSLVSALVKAGYKRNLSVRGAPYDFRKAPNENEEFFVKLKSLVEDTYVRNNNSRVMFTAHSLGNLYTIVFLRKMSPAWRKKFVRGFIATAAPIGGAVKSVLTTTAGNDFGYPVFDMSHLRHLERSLPSTAFLMPSPQFWKSDELIAARPGRNYTVANYQALYTDSGFTTGWDMRQDTAGLFDPMWKPDVDELYCTHGVGVATPEVLKWRSDRDFPDVMPEIVPGDGDGTVNLRSLLGCTLWPLKEHLAYFGVSHVNTLTNPLFIGDVMRILQQPDRYGGR